MAFRDVDRVLAEAAAERERWSASQEALRLDLPTRAAEARDGDAATPAAANDPPARVGLTGFLVDALHQPPRVDRYVGAALSAAWTVGWFWLTLGGWYVLGFAAPPDVLTFSFWGALAAFSLGVPGGLLLWPRIVGGLRGALATRHRVTAGGRP